MLRRITLSSILISMVLLTSLAAIAQTPTNGVELSGVTLTNAQGAFRGIIFTDAAVRAKGTVWTIPQAAADAADGGILVGDNTVAHRGIIVIDKSGALKGIIVLDEPLTPAQLGTIVITGRSASAKETVRSAKGTVWTVPQANDVFISDNQVSLKGIIVTDVYGANKGIIVTDVAAQNADDNILSTNGTVWSNPAGVAGSDAPADAAAAEGITADGMVMQKGIIVTDKSGALRGIIVIE